MPRYYFALDDDLPLSGAAEELANDTITSNVTTLNCRRTKPHRYGRDQVAVSRTRPGHSQDLDLF
jgi:hypothetical protein